MQLTRPRGNFIEKIVRDSNGRLVRASFCVYECDGHIKARLLSAVYIEENFPAENKISILGGLKQKEVYKIQISYISKVVSPYITSYLYYILGSKPRAPTLD